MSKIDEVKTKIRAGEINEAMSIAMAEAMKIEFVTSLSEDGGKSISVAFRTLIDLLQNEIENEFKESSESNSAIKQVENLHFQEVAIAHQRILQNVQSLQQMFELLQDNLKK